MGVALATSFWLQLRAWLGLSADGLYGRRVTYLTLWERGIPIYPSFSVLARSDEYCSTTGVPFRRQPFYDSPSNPSRVIFSLFSFRFLRFFYTPSKSSTEEFSWFLSTIVYGIGFGFGFFCLGSIWESLCVLVEEKCALSLINALHKIRMMERKKMPPLWLAQICWKLACISSNKPRAIFTKKNK